MGLIQRAPSRAGRWIAPRSRSPVMSSPSSNFWSNSSALIERHLFLARSPGRDDPDPLLPVGHHYRPVLALNLPDHQPSRLVRCPGRNLYPHDVLPERLCPPEVDAMLSRFEALLPGSNSNSTWLHQLFVLNYTLTLLILLSGGAQTPTWGRKTSRWLTTTERREHRD